MPCISINSGHLSISLSLRSPAPDKAFTTYTCSSQPPSAVPAICQYSHSVTSLFHLSTHSLKIHPHNPLDQYWINKAALHVPLCLITHKHTLLFKAKLISAYQCPYMFSFLLLLLLSPEQPDVNNPAPYSLSAKYLPCLAKCPGSG